MSKTRLALFLIAGLLSGGEILLRAQDAKILPPEPPYVIDPPTKSSWIITIERLKDTAVKAGPASPPPSGPTPVQIELKVDPNQLKFIQTTFSDGKTDFFYIIGERILRPSTSKSGVMMYDTPNTPGDTNHGRFPETSWIASAKCAGTEKIGDWLCYKFVLGAYQADISVENHCPAKVVTPQRIYNYLRLADIEAPLQLPQSFQAQLDERHAEMKALEIMHHLP